MQRASLIITDSGGIQEEAFYLNKPLIVTRNNTERPEAIDNNFSFLTELNPIKIAEKTHNLLNKNSTRHYNNIYGRGQASKKIINFLKNESRFL